MAAGVWLTGSGENSRKQKTKLYSHRVWFAYASSENGADFVCRGRNIRPADSAPVRCGPVLGTSFQVWVGLIMMPAVSAGVVGVI